MYTFSVPKCKSNDLLLQYQNIGIDYNKENISLRVFITKYSKTKRKMDA